MLSKPVHGWATITIGSWSDRISYLDDAAFLLLDSMILSCKEHQPASVRFDAEGWDYIVIFDWLETHIIEQKNTNELISFNIHRDVLAKELVKDIQENIKDWAAFVDYGDMTEEDKADREKELLCKCKELLSLAPSDDMVMVYPADKTD